MIDTKTDPLMIATRAVATVDELIARWKRAGHQPQSDHTNGRREGYLQSIALLLGTEVKDVRRALAKGEL